MRLIEKLDMCGRWVRNGWLIRDSIRTSIDNRPERDQCEVNNRCSSEQAAQYQREF
jgi:hypothetical protein